MVRRLSQDIRERVIRLRRAGFTQSRISKVVKISQPAVSAISRKAGLGEPIPQNHAPYPTATQDEALELYALGFGCPEVSKLLGATSPGTVNQWVKEAGLMRSKSEAKKLSLKMQAENAKRIRRQEALAAAGREDGKS